MSSLRSLFSQRERFPKSSLRMDGPVELLYKVYIAWHL